MVLSVTTCGERVTKELEYSAELLSGGVLTAIVICVKEGVESEFSTLRIECAKYTLDGKECPSDFACEELKLYPELSFDHALRAYILKEFGEPVVELTPGVYARKERCINYGGKWYLESELADTQFGLYLRKDCVEIAGKWYPKEKTEVCPKCGRPYVKGEYCKRCFVRDYKGEIIGIRGTQHVTAYNRGVVYISGEEFDKSWRFCRECTVAIPVAEMDGELDACPTCAECYRNAPILGYHEHDGRWPLKFYGAPASDFVGGGFELEIDKNEDSDEPRGDFNQEFAADLASSCGLEFNEIRFERDGSLNTGFEIISAPHTVKDFWAKQKNWADMLDACVRAGYRSHDAETCGLHVHVSRKMFGKSQHEQALNIGKVYRFYEGAWEELVKASRRRRFTYCDKNRVTSKHRSLTKFKDGTKAWGNRVSERVRGTGGHRGALNNDNSATFEYRLGRGTLNKMSFFAWIDLCFTITKNSKKSGKVLNESGSWIEWLDGIKEMTAKYLLTRNAFKTEVLKLFPQLEWENSDADSAIA